MQLLSSVLRMYDILEHNVSKVENIERVRDPTPGTEAAYLLCATTQNVDRLIKELSPGIGSQPQYDAAHVFFVDGTPPEHRPQLTTSGVGRTDRAPAAVERSAAAAAARGAVHQHVAYVPQAPLRG